MAQMPRAVDSVSRSSHVLASSANKVLEAAESGTIAASHAVEGTNSVCSSRPHLAAADICLDEG